MSTPEQPATPALTRKQLRDIRNTGATPIITDVPVAEPSPSADVAPEDRTDADDAGHPEPHATPAPVSAPLPRAAAPVAVHDLPGADASVDLGVAPLTRRQARQQERIRTASVPVITPDVAAAHAAHAEEPVTDESDVPRPDDSADRPEDGADNTVSEQEAGADGDTDDVEDHRDEHDADDDDRPDEAGTDAEEHVSVESVDEAPEHDIVPEATAEGADDAEESDADDATADESTTEEEASESEEEERAIVHPEFGSELLAGAVPAAELPPSFDQLISRSATGAIGTGNALILSQTPAAPPLVAPVAATGEVLITGTFNLPEGLGSTGHAPGTADGKDVDAVLVDGELPAHSSPTPIAASAAISTVKNGGDIIKPPAPEKGSRLMLTLAITAGALALALVGVLILAFVTGVF